MKAKRSLQTKDRPITALAPRPRPRSDWGDGPTGAQCSAALAEAVRRYGEGAIVGRNFHDGTLHVGKRLRAEWLVKGEGATFDEAFSAAKVIKPKGRREAI